MEGRGADSCRSAEVGLVFRQHVEGTKYFVMRGSLKDKLKQRSGVQRCMPLSSGITSLENQTIKPAVKALRSIVDRFRDAKRN